MARCRASLSCSRRPCSGAPPRSTASSGGRRAPCWATARLSQRCSRRASCCWARRSCSSRRASAITPSPPPASRRASRASAAGRASAGSRRPARPGGSPPGGALRAKEWALLRRDPWLISQTLMQLLYLLPPALLLWFSYRDHNGGTALLVPVLIMAAGQLGGGLAWLAISGEDAPDLVATAPVSAGRALTAKVEAVLGGIAMVFGPFALALAFVAPVAATVAVGGIVLAAASATAIQLAFRTQAKRSHFRRRQISSRIATFAEALSSIGWAAK